jgi:hypothetical protein
MRLFAGVKGVASRSSWLSQRQRLRAQNARALVSGVHQSAD